MNDPLAWELQGPVGFIKLRSCWQDYVILHINRCFSSDENKDNANVSFRNDLDTAISCALF